MASRVNVGTCGFGVSQAKYATLFSCVEVQHTFYQPPGISTLERWRAAVPDSFEFTLKAWQLITHEVKSPTYRRLKRKLTELEKQDAGYFKPTGIVNEAWEITLACAKALRAKTILFQCPASFSPTSENIANLEQFFSSIAPVKKREQLNFGWEPRGEWDTKVIKRICRAHDLWHVVDPFVAKSLTPDKCYFRLHGKKGWRYKYEEAELRELAALLPRGSQSDHEQYVFFNNVRMTEDALTFRKLLNQPD